MLLKNILKKFITDCQSRRLSPRTIGGNLNTLAQILGHADIKTTAEIYVGDADIDDLIEEHRRASPLSRLRIF